MSKLGAMIKNKTFPFVTVGLILLNVAYFVIVFLGGSPSNSAYMLSRGALYAPYVFERHEFWRLITCMFMHFSLPHLASNMIYLGILGFSFEKLVGHVKFLVFYMLSGIGASVVSAGYYQITGQPVISAGASGAIYGLISMVIYLTYIATRRTNTSALISRVVIMLIFMFYSNFGSGSKVDIVGHIGGLVFGFILCLLFLPVKRRRPKR